MRLSWRHALIRITRHCAVLTRTAQCVALLIILGACTALGIDGGTTERAQLERQRARWERIGFPAYRFTYSVACFCTGPTSALEIEVRQNTVTRAGYPGADQPVPVEEHNQLPTIVSLFEVIERAISDRADLIEVSYHPDMGYPTRIALDWSFNAADDEIVHLVTALAPIPPA